MKVALVVIFNHRYDANLDRLRGLYNTRFAEILFLVPFADELERVHPDVVSVHHGSYLFQGFLGEVRERLLAMDCDAWLVIGDDLIINPSLDQSNLHDQMNLQPDAAYIKNLANLYDASLVWSTSGHRTTFQALLSPSLEWRQNHLLPPPEEAFKKMGRLGFEFKPLGWRNLRDIESGKIDIYHIRMALGLFFSIHPVRTITQWKTKSVPYPLLYGYSDFLICPRNGMKDFLNYCLATAAMNLFVESAIPTCLALAFDEIVTELPRGENHHSETVDKTRPMHGVELKWAPSKEREAFEVKYNCSLNALFSQYPKDVLYYHPVKLSKWN